MGFLEGLRKGLNGEDDEREIVEMYHDIYEDDTDYRAKAFDNSESNNGWYTCPKCGRKFRATSMDVDHIIPQSRNGSNSRYNLQLLCAHCNRSKRNDTSDTDADLKRRKKELQEQDKLDIKYLKRIRKDI